MSTKIEQPIDQYVSNEKLINEEFKIWKKSVPLLYDTIQSYVLESPTLSLQSLPTNVLSTDKNTLKVNFLLSPFNTPLTTNLELASFQIPSTLSINNDNNSIPIKTGSSKSSTFNVEKKYSTKNGVNKIRYESNLKNIALFTSSGDVEIINDSNQESQVLKHHQGEGFALEWNPSIHTQLISGGEDKTVALWDINTTTPLKIYSKHDSIINDLSWNYKTPTLFGSVSDDRSIKFHDTRLDNTDELIYIVNAHEDSINSIEFNKSIETIFLTGSSDNLISIWDLRYPKQSIRDLYGHNGSITNLKFNPSYHNYLASSSNDRRIHIWDLNKIDESFDKDDYIKNEVEDPALIFIHGGHTAKITEFDWVHETNNTIISTGEDGLIEIWKPHLVEEEEDEDEDEEDESKDEEEKKKDEDEDTEVK